MTLRTAPRRRRLHKPAVLAVFAAVTTLAAFAVGACAPAPPATQKVTVTGGFGSGEYRPGTTVHVWSQMSPSQGIAQRWSGDVSLLAQPNEWHTTFVMPNRPVALAAQTTTRSVALKSEQFKGVTSVSKTVRYHFPANMRGVVMFNHGTGGSGRIIESAEAWPIALALIADGYGVVSIDAEEPVAGDQDGNGKLRWNSRGTAANVDLRNIQALFDSFTSRKLLKSTTRKFALGMSAGGAFSHFLGTVRSTSIAANFPQLRFAAVISYCADATGTSSATVTQTPSAWYMCGAEDNPEVSNAEAKANEAKLRSRGIATQYFEHQPSPLYDGRFARIAGISSATSKAMAAELRKAGVVDTAGFIKVDGDQVAARVRSSPSAFPQISANPNQAAIKSQIKTMRAEHSMFADFTRRTIDFFNRFNPR